MGELMIVDITELLGNQNITNAEVFFATEAAAQPCHSCLCLEFAAFKYLRLKKLGRRLTY
jgi:hypothetical protein